MPENSNLDIAMLTVCYGEKIATDFSCLEYRDVSDILKLTVADNLEAKVQEDSELNEILNKINFINSNYSENDEKFMEERIKKLQEYFYENNQIDVKTLSLKP